MGSTAGIRRVYIFGREFDEGFRAPFLQLLDRLNAYEVEVLLFKPFRDFAAGLVLTGLEGYPVFYSYSEIRGSDSILFSIGGDGSFLEAVTFVREQPVPIAGINSGRLGFLADISRDEIYSAVDEIMQGRAGLDERALLRIAGDQPVFGDFNFALNEVTVHKRDVSSMIKISAFLDEQFLNTYWADGLIVATPTGSTAYSLSVGGPLVLPDSRNFVVSPIAPHNLTVRPLVYNDSMTLRLHVETRSGTFMVSADSRSTVIDDRIELTISKAPFCIQTIRLSDHNFYHTLRTKLMWGADRRN
jgi:NAD+ kinase